MRSANPAYLAVAALVLLSLVWGYNWVVMKEVLRYADPFDFSAYRTLLGATALFIVVLLKRWPLSMPAIREVALLGLVQTGVFTALIQWALVSGGAGKTAVLVYAMPFWLFPMAAIVLGERVRGRQWAVIALAACGLLLILEPWRAQGSVTSSVLALGAGMTWALATILAKRLRARHAVDLLSLTAWQMLIGASALCIVAYLHPSSQPIDPTPYFFAALAYNALAATALAWWLWLFILQHLSTGVAGLSALGVPIVGVLGGWIELGERPSGPELTGMLLIALALAMNSVWSVMQARRIRRAGTAV